MTAVMTRELSRFPAGKGPDHVLKAVDLDVPEGACLGLLGGNGAGKSTLLKMLVGAAPIGHGVARLHGHAVPTPASREGVAYLPETAIGLDYLSGQEYLTLFARLEGVPTRAVADSVNRSLSDWGLAEAAAVPLARYSKGMRQKIELARTLICPRRLLILDEPMNGLDSTSQLLLEDRLAALREAGVTMVITSHSIRILERLATHFLVIRRGRAVQFGTRDQVLGVVGWTVELAPDSPMLSSAPPGATRLAGRPGFLFTRREDAMEALSAALSGGQLAAFAQATRGVDDVLREVNS